ncbi:hypothetical protein P4284_15710 [Bacillus swezeyi]|nr:hypothetical protein [Bacillus swezeyi]
MKYELVTAYRKNDITTLFIISRGLNVPIKELFYVEEIEEEQ